MRVTPTRALQFRDFYGGSVVESIVLPPLKICELLRNVCQSKGIEDSSCWARVASCCRSLEASLVEISLGLTSWQALSVVMLVLLMWSVWRQQQHQRHRRRPGEAAWESGGDEEAEEGCPSGEQQRRTQEELHALAGEVHHVLETLGWLHWLCLGSLWGQLRRSAAMPWDRRVSLCLRNEQALQLDEVFVERRFRSHGLQLSYDSAEGQYEVRRIGQPRVLARLVVFEESSQGQTSGPVLRRVGWKRRLLPPDCDLGPSLQCFPSRLAEPPLPLREFGGRLLPVPREGIEVQKFHYPNDWWREVQPTPRC